MNSLSAAIPGCLATPVREIEPGLLEASFLFPSDFMGFSGHFPGNPVLPGIVQIMAAACTAGSGIPLSLRQVKRCKFQRPVRPEELLQVRVRLEKQSDATRAQAELRAAGEPCAVMTLIFADSDEPGCPTVRV